MLFWSIASSRSAMPRPSATTFVLRKAGLLGVRIGMRQLRILTPMTREHGLADLPPIGRQAILGGVVERIAELLFDLGGEQFAALGIPPSGGGHRLDRGYDVPVAELALQLVDVIQAVPAVSGEGHRPRRHGQGGRKADDLPAV